MVEYFTNYQECYQLWIKNDIEPYEPQVTFDPAEFTISYVIRQPKITSFSWIIMQLKETSRQFVDFPIWK